MGVTSVRGSCVPDVGPLLSAFGASGCRPHHLTERLHLQPQAVRLNSVEATAEQRLLDSGTFQEAAAWPLSYLLPEIQVQQLGSAAALEYKTLK